MRVANVLRNFLATPIANPRVASRALHLVASLLLHELRCALRADPHDRFVHFLLNDSTFVNATELLAAHPAVRHAPALPARVRTTFWAAQISAPVDLCAETAFVTANEFLYACIGDRFLCFRREQPHQRLFRDRFIKLRHRDRGFGSAEMEARHSRAALSHGYFNPLHQAGAAEAVASCAVRHFRCEAFIPATLALDQGMRGPCAVHILIAGQLESLVFFGVKDVEDRDGERDLIELRNCRRLSGRLAELWNLDVL